MPGEILITGVDGKRATLLRLDAGVGKETLGAIQAIGGNKKAEIVHLRQKADDLADSMRTGLFSKTTRGISLLAKFLFSGDAATMMRRSSGDQEPLVVQEVSTWCINMH
jgi:hypothetical protein